MQQSPRRTRATREVAVSAHQPSDLSLVKLTGETRGGPAAVPSRRKPERDCPCEALDDV